MSLRSGAKPGILAPPANTGSISFAPPFVQVTAMSASGILAVGTADGRVWLGTGGDKLMGITGTNKKTRSRKWEGLRQSDAAEFKVADGCVVL